MQGFYNIYFHRLRDIPDPLVNRFSSVSRHIAIFRGKHVHIIAALHLKYGPVVRFGPNEVSYITSQAWKDIYGHGRADVFIKDNSFLGVRPHDIEVIMTLQDHKEHARVRRAFNPAFSERAAREQETVLTNYADQMVWRMGENAKNSGAFSRVNLADKFTFAAFDAIADLSFGEPLHLLDRGEYIPWVSIIFDSAKFAAWSGVLQKMLGSPLDKWFASFLLAPFKEKAYAHFKFAADMVDKRLQQTKTERSDVWSFVLRHREDSDATLTLEEMRANAGVTIIGGSETSALCLGTLSFFIMQDQEVYSKLTREIRTNFHNESDICFTRLAKLPYLNACLSETLRIFPPGPAGSPGFVPQGGEQVDGIFLPGGVSESSNGPLCSILTVTGYCLCHSIRILSSPFQFP